VVQSLRRQRSASTQPAAYSLREKDHATGHRLIGTLTDRDVVFCEPADDISRATDLMAQHHISRMYVCEGDILKGVISLSEVAQASRQRGAAAQGDRARGAGSPLTIRGVPAVRIRMPQSGCAWRLISPSRSLGCRGSRRAKECLKSVCGETRIAFATRTWCNSRRSQRP
jgi:hypothetical protein